MRTNAVKLYGTKYSGPVIGGELDGKSLVWNSPVYKRATIPDEVSFTNMSDNYATAQEQLASYSVEMYNYSFSYKFWYLDELSEDEAYELLNNVSVIEGMADDDA